MYLKKEVVAGKVIEITKYHSSRYKNPCAPKVPNHSKTTKAQWIVNEKNSIDGLRLLLLENFKKEDIRLDLTYAGTEPDEKEATRRVNNFLVTLRRHYQKEGYDLKWVMTTECEGHRIHHHLLVNNIGWGRAEYNKLWKWADLTYKAFRYYDGAPQDAMRVAKYFVKETRKTFAQKDRLQRSRYRASRNLRKPKITKEVIQSKTWKEPRPKKGYYIEKPIEYGYTAFGYPYMFYRMVKEGDGNEVSHQKKSGTVRGNRGRKRKHTAAAEEPMHTSGRGNTIRRNGEQKANGANTGLHRRAGVPRKARKVPNQKETKL